MPLRAAQTRIANVRMKRGYKAARPGRLVGGFNPFAATSPRGELREQLRGMIAHAREGAHNIDYLAGYEMMVRRHVVGPRGIQLQADVRNADGTANETANRAIEAAWARWQRPANASYDGRLSWWQVELTAATMAAREGNFLLRLRRGSTRGPFGLQVEPVAFDRLDLNLHRVLDGGAWIEAGIEYAPTGAVRAYHLWRAHPSDAYRPGSQRRVRIPARDIVHVWRARESEQGLGVPAAHTALRRLSLIAKYEESALAAAHYGASAMLFFKSDEASPDAPAQADGAPPVDEIEPGTTATLPPGMDVANWQPNYPDGEMPAFAKHMVRGAATGLGASYSSLSSDLEGANFSSLRAGLSEERDEWRMFQRELYERLHQPVFEAWWPIAALTGAVDADALGLDAGATPPVRWRPRGWPSVNPKDDSAANESDLANRLRAPSDIARDRGEDLDETLARYAADIERMRALGLGAPVASEAPQQATPPRDGRPGET